MSEEFKMERKKLIGIIVAGILVGLTILGVVFLVLVVHELRPPKFDIVSYNDDYDFSYDENFNVIVEMTVYVKLRNIGADGSKTVYCEITRYDLTTYTKSQNVFKSREKKRLFSFSFPTKSLNRRFHIHTKFGWTDSYAHTGYFAKAIHQYLPQFH